MFYRPLPRNLEAALRDATDPKIAVRVSAVHDLVPHGATINDDDSTDSKRIVAALEKALTDAAPAVRSAAADALGELKVKAALPALLVAVEDEDQLVRQTAILALGNIRDARAQKRLERALSDPRPEVRFQAVMAYPRVVSARADAVRALADATHDSDEAVAHIAFRMAEELSEEGGAAVDPAILARARRVVGSGPPKVRAVTAVLLASAGDPAGDETLAAVVRGEVKTDEPDDLAAAIELAGERGLTSARAALEQRAFGGVLKRDPFQWHARVALARMGHERAKRMILADLGALSYERRTLAVSAAGKARLQEARPKILAMRDRPDRAEQGAVSTAIELLEAQLSKQGAT